GGRAGHARPPPDLAEGDLPAGRGGRRGLAGPGHAGPARRRPRPGGRQRGDRDRRPGLRGHPPAQTGPGDRPGRLRSRRRGAAPRLTAASRSTPSPTLGERSTEHRSVLVFRLAVVAWGIAANMTTGSQVMGAAAGFLLVCATAIAFTK